MPDYKDQNEKVWDQWSQGGSEWSKPVSKEEIDNAKNGNPQIKLSDNKFVPSNWMKDIKGKKVLCLAGGGGQQGPLLSAAGASVTVIDISQEQLDRDILVAKEFDLNLKTIKGDMTDLSMIEDESFDIVIIPVSINFIEDISKLWNEVSRVVKKNGVLMIGFINPIYYIFNLNKADQGIVSVENSLPTSQNLSSNNIDIEAVEFGHTLEQIVGGITQNGFVIKDMYEDNDATDLIGKYFSKYIVLRAVKV